MESATEPAEATRSSPAAEPARAAAAAPLRLAVLAGRYFGAAHRAAGEDLARLIAGRASVSAWFGAEHAARLLADPPALRGALDRDIAAIDAMIAAQLDVILHHARLRRLEGTWRGLSWLLDGIEPAARVKVKILNAGWAEICRDLERAAEFDQSHLFRHVYESEFGSPGGEPYGLLVIDHEVRHRPGAGAPTDDVTALASLAGIAAAAFAPTVLAASPALLEVDSFADLAITTDPAAPLRGPDHVRWRSLAAREDSRFLAIALPRVLARVPWADDPARADGFRYAEFAPDAGTRVWMTAAYGFAEAVIRAFSTHGWPADVRGAEQDRLGGGVVSGLPAEPFRTDRDRSWVRPPLDLVLTDRQERSLVDGGLMPISALPFTEEAVFGAVRSLQAPQQYTGANAAAATANARISSQLNSMLCVSRFAHYVKMLGRNMVGSYKTADEIEVELQNWLNEYINVSSRAGGETRARYPLIGGRVTIRERPGRPGVFGCVIHLQPQFQLDDVAATFRLVTDIVAPGSQR
ncbi:MAG: type VI secretion system contractile sheath large subunit [Rhodospirillales bacterium]|nr:type VI secretion system contractile sheath large subunit [Rhodospirillales bacterium]MDE2574447.1 type VI secretion system contractile sheath large subunit [Rhodospirillales bacterium]